jgi:hypothetical protein
MDAEEAYEGFFRIGIDTTKIQVFPWFEFQKRARVSSHWRRILTNSARQDGSFHWPNPFSCMGGDRALTQIALDSLPHSSQGSSGRMTVPVPLTMPFTMPW